MAEEESEAPEINVHLGKVEKDCRICHLVWRVLSMKMGVDFNWVSPLPDKIHSLSSQARGVVGVHDIEPTEEPLSDANGSASPVVVSPSAPRTETRSFWQGQRVLNFLLACMVFAFVISWLFHFRAPSHA